MGAGMVGNALEQSGVFSWWLSLDCLHKQVVYVVIKADAIP